MGRLNDENTWSLQITFTQLIYSLHLQQFDLKIFVSFFFVS